MRLAAAACYLLMLAAPFDARQQQDLKKDLKESQARADLFRYHGMLAAYRLGDEANSVDALLFLSDERLDALLGLINTTKDPFSPWDQRRRQLAVMLHTDLALRLAPDGDTRAAMRQLDIAIRLLSMPPRTDPGLTNAFADQWFYTVSRYLKSRNSPFADERLLAIGRTLFPDSAVILYESGTLAESLATDYAMAGAQMHFSRLRGLTFDLNGILRGRRARLEDAAAWLRQAAARDANNDLLQVHLGRVLALLELDTEAARVLSEARGRTADDATGYLAGIFLGGLRERQGDLAEASAAYRAAVERFPIGHAGYIGLSEVQQRLGKGDESRQSLMRLLLEAAGPTHEPLWWYQFDPPVVAEGRIGALRTKVRK
jgi:tetratricopeptide (TPR) repeat protein